MGLETEPYIGNAGAPERGPRRLPGWFGGVAGAVGLLVVWQVLGVAVFQGSKLVPAPSAILHQIGRDGWRFYLDNLHTTLRQAGYGWLWGNGLALVMAAGFVIAPFLERALLRVALASFALPLIAIGPILQILYNGDAPKIILAALSVFFNTLIGVLLGLRSASRADLDLVHALGGGRVAKLRFVRVRSSLPSLFAALRIAAPAAILGAIIGEYLGGESGLGVAMVNSEQAANIQRTWALALVAAAAAGLAYGLTALVERLVTPWAAGTALGSPPLRPERPGRAAIWKLLGRVSSPLISVAGVLIAWQLFLQVFHVSHFIGRGPVDVWRHLWSDADAATNRHLLFAASFTTLRDAWLGLVAGTAVAIAAAFVFDLQRWVERALMPMALVLRSVPLVAMTPLIALMFGRGLLGVTVIAGLVTFFPTLVNLSIALRSAPKESLDLCRAYSASRVGTLRRVQIPYSLPALFASLRIAAPLALIGALLAEYLATAHGLGFLMLQASSNFRSDDVWSATALITLYSVLMYEIMGAIEKWTLTRFGAA
jgi:ABC-type nitrate/sulfonate/bicarbonate transport system permease component